MSKYYSDTTNKPKNTVKYKGTVSGDQKIGKNHPKFEKSSQNSCQPHNCQNIYMGAQFISQKTI